jgi:hypothetical protein
VELAKRQEKSEKNAEKLENQSKKDFTKEFKTSWKIYQKMSMLSLYGLIAISIR